MRGKCQGNRAAAPPPPSGKGPRPSKISAPRSSVGATTGRRPRFAEDCSPVPAPPARVRLATFVAWRPVRRAVPGSLGWGGSPPPAGTVAARPGAGSPPWCWGAAARGRRRDPRGAKAASRRGFALARIPLGPENAGGSAPRKTGAYGRGFLGNEDTDARQNRPRRGRPDGIRARDGRRRVSAQGVVDFSGRYPLAIAATGWYAGAGSESSGRSGALRRGSFSFLDTQLSASESSGRSGALKHG